jgi:AAA+ superfamily predicted ATPase
LSLDPTGDYLAAEFARLGAALAALAAGEGATGSPLAPIATASAPGPVPSDGRLAQLVNRFGLTPEHLGLLLCALAPSLDSRFGDLYARFDARLGRTSVRVDLALALTGQSAWSAADRARLAPGATLRQTGLVELAGPGPSLLDHVVSVPERVVSFLVGGDSADPRVTALSVAAAPLDVAEVGDIGRALTEGLWFVWIHDRSGAGLSMGASALALLGAPAVVLDLDRLAPGATLADVLPMALLEAGLRGGGVVAGPVVATRDIEALRSMVDDPVRPIVLVSHGGWDPVASGAVPVLVEAPRVTQAHRQDIWRLAAEGLGVTLDDRALEELGLLRLSPERILSASASASGLAQARAEPVGIGHLRHAALLQGSTRLVQLAQRVVPVATFDDLVAPAELMAELRALPGRYETREKVKREWGLARGADRGVGITCLFAGPSGTGKTLAAEVVAHSLGVDLFIVNLSQIVDKYIGETEKNLERVFSEAEGVNGVLLFDEADALFGKRSEVESAHDRYANIEVAYLLQRMERYDGIAVLTTNLRGNIDEAFSRRLDVVCSFTDPTPDERRALWERHLPPALPVSDDIDLAALAEHLPVPGGLIRNMTISAAHAAAVDQRPVAMADLVVAAAREYRKMGRLFNVPTLVRWLEPSGSSK